MQYFVNINGEGVNTVEAIEADCEILAAAKASDKYSKLGHELLSVYVLEPDAEEELENVDAEYIREYAVFSVEK